MAGFRDYLRMAMGWWSTPVDLDTEVDRDTIWHVRYRPVTGGSNKRHTIANAPHRATATRAK